MMQGILVIVYRTIPIALTWLKTGSVWLFVELW